MPFVDGFLPSRSAPLFHNGPWPQGLDLRISVGGLPSVSIDVTRMGLCGGMAFLARDIHESGTPQLRSTDPRTIPLATGRHILHRLLESFLGPGVIPYWVHATQEPDRATWFGGRGLYAETLDAAREVMRYVDAGGLVPVGVVLAQSAWPWDVFSNHVELVYGYDLDGTVLTLHVYDSNVEGSDNVTIRLDLGASAPAQPILTNGTSTPGQSGRIRGFFVLPYQHQDPGPAYVDDGAVTWSGPSTVNVENTGSTTFDSGRGYALGSLSGDTRFPLEAPLDPGRVAEQSVPATALVDGLRLQLLGPDGGVFGRPTGPLTAPVAAPVRAS